MTVFPTLYRVLYTNGRKSRKYDNCMYMDIIVYVIIIFNKSLRSHQLKY